MTDEGNGVLADTSLYNAPESAIGGDGAALLADQLQHGFQALHEPNEESPLLHSPASSASMPVDKLPWHRRPSPSLLLPGIGLLMTSWGMTLAPRLEAYTQLVCHSLEHEQASPPGALSARDCRQSPTVAKKVAELNMAITLVMGILSALTTAYWGGLSDRIGRRRIICLASFGFFLNELTFIVVVHFVSVIPYQMLVVGSVLDGFLGGIPTFQAAITAYISDCTPAGSRARILSAVGGMIFIGIAIGPMLGGISMKVSGNFLLPFWIAATCHLTLSILWGLFLPESTTKQQRAEARHKDSERVKAAAEEQRRLARVAKEERWSLGKRSLSGLRSTLRRSFGFVNSLTILAPRRGGFEEVTITAASIDVNRRHKRDWNLSIVALGYAIYVSTIAVYLIKIQYSQFKFDLGPEANSYYLTAVGLTRTIALLFIIPFFIKRLKRNPYGPSNSSNSSTTSPLENSQHDLPSDAHQQSLERNRLLYDSHFDLQLARFSLLIDFACYIFIILNTSVATFIIPSLLTALGGGAGPAIQSLALSLTPPHQSGQLLASLSVLQSLTSNVFGPLLFGVLFSATVGRFSEAVFVVGASLFLLSFVALSLVRLAPKSNTT